MGPLGAWFAYSTAERTHHQRVQIRFEEAAQLRAQRIREQISSYAEVLHACHGLYDASEEVTRVEFATFTRQARGRHPCINAIAWAPLSEWAGQPEARLRFIEPLARHRRLLHTDLRESDQVRPALERALGERHPMLAAPLMGDLAGNSTSAHGLYILGVHAAADDGGQAAPLGAVLLTFRFVDLIASGRPKGQPHLMRVALFDVTPGDAAELAGIDGAPTDIAAGISAQLEFEIAGRRWRLSALPTRHFLSRHETREPMVIATIVFVVWELLAGLLLALSHASRSNAVRRQGRNVARIMQSLGEGVLVAGADGRVRITNAAARRLFGGVLDGADASIFERSVHFMHAEDGTAYSPDDAPLRRAMRGEVFDQVACLVHTPACPEGVYVSVSGSPLRDEWGHLLGGVLALRDDTERRRSDEALRDRDAKLRQRQVEMDLAAEVQKRFYPSSPPRVQGLDIAGAVRPADETCGDYYDFLELPDGSLLLAVGDVSGHGLGPAIVMAETRAYVRSLARAGHAPREVLERCNAQLCHDLADDLFVTMLLVRVSADGRMLSYASAGHTPALLISTDGELKREFVRGGPPLGIVEDYRYRAQDGIAFAQDEILVLMTDGVTEANSRDGEEHFEEEGVLQVVAKHRHRQAGQILREVGQALDRFAGEQSRRDEVTLMVCQRAEARPARRKRSLSTTWSDA
ncbi:MAG: SpoIIE family protein phosphatase [Planctomycetota bacterium]|nr:SpoIIE family protein phosphatase [Planctomycetota bacterium]